LEDEGDPIVDLDFFKCSVAKAILFRTAEKLFSTLALDGYRANTVAYALSWLAEHSHHRIDLERVWEEQRVPPETQEAMKNACQSAYKHLTQTSGNVGEWSKKAECWDGFQRQDIVVGPGWESEWAETSYLTAPTELDAVAQDWERLRLQFVEDSRTLGELEALTGRVWLAKHREDEARMHAVRKWAELRGPGGRRFKNLRDFVELFSAAAKLGPDV
jgi:hypothetical protein